MTDHVDTAKTEASTLRTRASDAAAKTRAKASETAQQAKAKAAKAAETVKAKGKQAGAKASTGIESNPLAAIAGGLAIGAILAGILPRTATEDRAVGKVGTRVRSTTRNVIKSAKENARAQLDEMGLNPDSAREKLGGIAGKVAEAAAAVGKSTAETVLKKK
jgi:ElaB/YqjD/DUF883 family membrane-anchored ribosome-binding protein